MSDEVNVEVDAEGSILELGQRDYIPSRSTRASSGDFLNIMDSIVDNADEDFDKERETTMLEPPPSLPKDAFANSFARGSRVAEAIENSIPPVAVADADADAAASATHAADATDAATSATTAAEAAIAASTADEDDPVAVPSEEKELANISSLLSNDSFISLERSDTASDTVVAPETPPPPTKPPLRKVSLDEMVMEVERLSVDVDDALPLQAADKPKGKKAAKPHPKKVHEADGPPSLSDLNSLPSLVGSKVGKAARETKSDMNADPALSHRRRSGGKLVDKLPPVRHGTQGKHSKRRTETELNRSHEAEDILEQDRHPLPQLPHSSPMERVHGFQRKRHGKPLYLRMQAQALRQAAEEEQQKHEEYLRLRNQRARGRVSRDELRAHMKQHDELMRARASEAKQNHLAQMKALRRKNRELHDDLHAQAASRSQLGEPDSQASLSGSPPGPQPSSQQASPVKHKQRQEVYDAIEYKVTEDARERKKKYAKLQEMLSEKKNRYKKNYGKGAASSEDRGEEEEEEEEAGSPSRLLAGGPSTPRARREGEEAAEGSPQRRRGSPRAEEQLLLSPRIPPGRDERQEKMREGGEEVTVPGLDAPAPPAVREPVEVDPFADVVADSALEIAGGDIATHLAEDWRRLLHAGGEGVDALIA